jgi:hypothetical protein
MFCPQCGKEIAEKQRYCAECGNPLACAVASETSEVKKAKSIPAWRWAIYGPLCVAALVFVVYSVTHQAEAERENAEFVRRMVEKPQWNEIIRKTIVSQTIDLQGSYGWSKDSFSSDRKVKTVLIVHCAASDSSRVVFAVMDQENIKRLQGGYPAFVLYSSAIAKPIQVETPQGKPYWYGFVEPGEKPSQPGSIPTDKFGALIYLMDAYQRSHRPPVRLTVQIELIVSYFSTRTEARRQQGLLRQAGLRQLEEKALMQEVRSIGEAVAGFCKAYDHQPQSLADLTAVNMVNPEFASGKIAGYSVWIHADDCSAYQVMVTPAVWSQATPLNLYLDETGQLHGNRENRIATANDPVIQ